MTAHHSHKRREIIKFFRAYQAHHGTSPTIREIVARFDFTSTSVASYHLNKLVDAGALARRPKGSARCYYVRRAPSARAATLALADETATLLTDLRARIRNGEDADTVLSAALSNLDSAPYRKESR